MINYKLDKYDVWARAPKDATHRTPGTLESAPMWLKQVDGEWHFKTLAGASWKEIDESEIDGRIISKLDECTDEKGAFEAYAGQMAYFKPEFREAGDGYIQYCDHTTDCAWMAWHRSARRFLDREANAVAKGGPIGLEVVGYRSATSGSLYDEPWGLQHPQPLTLAEPAWAEISRRQKRIYELERELGASEAARTVTLEELHALEVSMAEAGKEIEALKKNRDGWCDAARVKAELLSKERVGLVRGDTAASEVEAMEVRRWALGMYNDCGGYSPKMVDPATLPDPDEREHYVSSSDFDRVVAQHQRIVAEKDASIERHVSQKLEVYRKHDALVVELRDLRDSMSYRTSLIGRIEAERDGLREKVAKIAEKDVEIERLKKRNEWLEQAAVEIAENAQCECECECVPSGWMELSKRLIEALGVFTGHDSHPNLIHRYGEKWWEPIDGMRKELRELLSSKVSKQNEVVAAWSIKIEKLLCEKLGRDWTATGISIASLIEELAGRSSQGRAELEVIGYARRNDLEALLDESMPKGSHVRIGIDHKSCWEDEEPYEWLVPIYAATGRKGPDGGAEQ